MIDLYGYSEILMVCSFDVLEASVTVTIKDGAGVITLGQLKMDQSRLRPFTDALREITKVYYDDLSPTPQGYRMNFDVNQNKALVTFG